MNIISLPTNYQFVNLAGQRYGKLQVLCYAGCKIRIRDGKQVRGKSLWLCKCDCQTLCVVNNSDIKSGSTKSCGCDKDIKTSLRLGTHGMSYSPTYKSWAMMIQRATNFNINTAKNYCGRGITVCERWRNSFENFILDMGERPQGTSIDRIDVNGNYEPSNCRWATKQQQSMNRRTTKNRAQ